MIYPKGSSRFNTSLQYGNIELPGFFYCKTNVKRLGSFALGRLMENDHAFHIPISNVTQDFGPMSCTVSRGNRSRILQALDEPNNTYNIYMSYIILSYLTSL